MPYIGKAPSSGIRSRFIYTATSGQTTFTGADDNNKTLGYTDSEYVDVYLNGVLLEPSDYTATSKTSVVLDSGATAGDTMEIVVYDTFGVFNGTFSGDITVGGGATIDGLLIKDKEIGTSAAPATLQVSAINSGQIGGRRNLIINGAAEVSQRPTGTVNNGETYGAVDRFVGFAAAGGTFTLAQSTDSPDGYNNSILATVTSADSSIASSDFYGISQRIEGQNIYHLGFGSSAAKTLTLSFYVKSSVTGTFGGAIRNNAVDRSFVFSYTVNSADTWELKTVTITGDTSGTWLTTNEIGLRVSWSLGDGSSRLKSAGSFGDGNFAGVTGQTNLISTGSATLQLTGVQVEVGSVATEFEHRSFGEELELCERYYRRLGAPRVSSSNFGYVTGASVNANAGQGVIHHHPEMRANPSVEHTGTASDYKIKSQNSNKTCSSTPQFTSNSQQTTILWFTASGLLTSGFAVHLQNATTDGFVAFEAEL